MTKQLKKSDLINILVDKYGYEKEDLKYDAQGKPYTNAGLKALIRAEEVEEKELAESATRVQSPKSTLKENDKIYVMSGVPDVLVYHSLRTNRTWTFNNFGDQDTIEYHELITMRNRHPRFFTEGFLIVLDREIQKEFNLEEMYKNVLLPENVDKVFEMELDELDRFVDTLPEGQKSLFVNLAHQRYESGKLDSTKIIKHIEKKFNFSFDDNAPLDAVVSTREKVGVANIIIVDKV